MVVLRTGVNELEEHFKEKKKKFKYEIKFADENKQLEQLEDMDPENVDLDVIDMVIQLPNGPEFVEKMRKEKTIIKS